MNPIPLEEQLRRMTPGKLTPGRSLRQLINRLVGNLLIVAAGSRTSISNEVSPEVYFVTEETKVASVLDELLTTVVANARQGKIHISADSMAGILTIDIQERNNYNGYALAHSIKCIEGDVATLNGALSIKGYQQLATTISLSIPDSGNRPVYEC